ncbi:uncharacterized protein LOC144388935 [Gasterosteus aculeatus]
MGRPSNGCGTLALLIVLLLFPVRSGCKEYAYKSLTENKPECCDTEDAMLKRLKDVDYDGFVGLMGRRSVAKHKRHIDHMFADMLQRQTGMACPCVGEYLTTNGGPFINNGGKRFQRFPYAPPPQRRP